MLTLKADKKEHIKNIKNWYWQMVKETTFYVTKKNLYIIIYIMHGYNKLKIYKTQNFIYYWAFLKCYYAFKNL